MHLFFKKGRGLYKGLIRFHIQWKIIFLSLDKSQPNLNKGILFLLFNYIIFHNEIMLQDSILLQPTTF